MDAKPVEDMDLEELTLEAAERHSLECGCQTLGLEGCSDCGSGRVYPWRVECNNWRVHNPGRADLPCCHGRGWTPKELRLEDLMEAFPGPLWRFYPLNGQPYWCHRIGTRGFPSTGNTPMLAALRAVVTMLREEAKDA